MYPKELDESFFVLVTKFNAPLPSLDDGGARPGLDTRWLSERVSLFGEWAIPSVIGQVRQPDAWLILIDADTPTLVQKEIREMVPSYARIQAVSEALTDPVLSEIVRGLVPEQAATVISARLDSDDALLPEYCSTVGDVARSGWRGFVSPCLGVQVVAGLALIRIHTSGPFIARIENAADGDLDTVFCDFHTRVRRHGPVRSIWGTPLWIQVVHQRNISNRVAGVPLVGRRTIAKMEEAGLPKVEVGRLGRVPIGSAVGGILEMARVELSIIRDRVSGS